MGKWLRQLRKIPEPLGDGTDKTDKTSSQEVSSVLSVSKRAVFDNFPLDSDSASEGSVSFVSSPTGHILNFFVGFGDRSGWDDEAWQAAYEERAAVLEFDEGVPRDDAERQARQEIENQQKRWIQ